MLTQAWQTFPRDAYRDKQEPLARTLAESLKKNIPTSDLYDYRNLAPRRVAASLISASVLVGSIDVRERDVVPILLKRATEPIPSPQSALTVEE